MTKYVALTLSSVENVVLTDRKSQLWQQNFIYFKKFVRKSVNHRKFSTKKYMIIEKRKKIPPLPAAFGLFPLNSVRKLRDFLSEA